ncbi:MULTISPECIES: acyl-CoA dehydrogenase family protein [unclassified Streptomyces]|uniref:acyl-CoA dehydrogenase family protein n=1 Tax=unclassified Streptomyces TaxID=2593676 RepID=UPI0036F62E69
MPGFLAGLAAGRTRWDLLERFPRSTPDERAAGDAAAAAAAAHIDATVDPEDLDRDRRLPDGFLAGLQERGLLRLCVEADLGGLGLTSYEAFRTLTRAARGSVTAGQVMAIQAGVGATALLPALPEGPLRDHVRKRIAEGVVSGFGDTDRTGQNNTWPALTGTPTEDGAAYVLRGEKLFIGNGPVADLLPVSVTLLDPDRRRLAIAYLDTSDPAFEVDSRIEFMGSRGLPNGSLAFHGLRVERERILVEGDGDRLPAAVAFLALTGRLHFTGAPALAIAENCAEWSRSFVRRREVDGRPLGTYDQVRRIVALTLAEVFAMDAVARLSLIGAGLVDRWPEQLLAKNILVRAAGRVVDRTVGLLGAEGFETVASKRARGAEELPVERAYRDARGLRIAGNVDFRLDHQAARLLLDALDDDGADHTDDRPDDTDDRPEDHGRGAGALALSPANRDHAAEVDRLTAELRALCRGLLRRHPDRDALYERQETTALVARAASELLSCTAALAWASHLTGQDADEGPAAWGGDPQDLADIHCTEALHRAAGHFRRLAAGDTAEPDHAKVSHAWLTGATRV